MGSLNQYLGRPLSVPPLTTHPEEPRWYAIHTRSRHEKSVFTQLQAKGVLVFLPLVARIHRWSDRKQQVELPLFPGYAFVKLTLFPAEYHSVMRTAGVLGFVGEGKRGTPIPDKEIEDIRTIVEHKHPFSLFPFLKEGQQVRIRGGCLNGVEGILLAKDFNKSILVSVGLIQRSITIEVGDYDIEII